MKIQCVLNIMTDYLKCFLQITVEFYLVFAMKGDKIQDK